LSHMSKRSEDQIAKAGGWRVWALLIAAPVLWLGLWLASRALCMRLRGGMAGVEAVSEQLRLWVTLVTELGLLGCIVFWLRKNGRALAAIGLTAGWPGREMLIGALAGLMLGAAALVPLWLLRLGHIVPGEWPLLLVRAPTQLIVAIGIAVCEEVIWRGYALTELHRLYRLSASVVIAVIAFATFYLGQAVLFDWLRLPLMLYVGGWLSVLYLWRRSLIAPIIAHIVLCCIGLI